MKYWTKSTGQPKSLSHADEFYEVCYSLQTRCSVRFDTTCNILMYWNNFLNVHSFCWTKLQSQWGIIFERHTNVPTYIHHTYINTYTHTYINTYIHKHTHTYTKHNFVFIRCPPLRMVKLGPYRIQFNARTILVWIYQVTQQNQFNLQNTVLCAMATKTVHRD
jgi:hypothetical protein